MNKKKDSSILITGSSRGIGAALARVCHQEGFEVILHGRSKSKNLLNLAKELNSQIIYFDVTDEIELKNSLKQLKKLNILINCAGINISKPFNDLSKADWQSVYDVNVFGVISLIQCLLPFFKKDSHVVNISSIGGISGSSKFPGLTAYSSSKGALNILTEVLAEEFKESGPKFNSLSLGSVNTPMLNKAFPGYKAQVNPNEMASFIFDFANNSSKVFNGKVIPVSSSNP